MQILPLHHNIVVSMDGIWCYRVAGHFESLNNEFTEESLKWREEEGGRYLHSLAEFNYNLFWTLEILAENSPPPTRSHGLSKCAW